MEIRRAWNYLRYRFNPNWRFNISSTGEGEKLRRWFEFISNVDKENVERISKSIVELCEERKHYTASLIAHGSSTYGKRDYNDVDLVLEPSNGKIEMYDELFDRLRKDFDIEFAGDFCLNDNWNLEFNQAHLYPKKGKLVQIAYRTNIFTEGCQPFKGNELTGLMRRLKKPHVAIVLDNLPVK